MLIAIVTVSIVVITALVWLGNRIIFLRHRFGRVLQVCPICAGVFGTWIWLLALYFVGYPIDGVVPALLMGGSVVGIAYQLAPSEALPPAGLEKKLFVPAEATAGEPSETAGWRTPLLFKTLFMSVGFIAAYSVLAELWSAFFLSFIALLQILLIFRSPRNEKVVYPEAVEELEKKMENCC